MTEEEKLAKKLLSLTEGMKTKTPKDLYTAILTRMNRSRSHDIYIEYFECLEDVRQVKAGIKINLENNSISGEIKKKGEDIISNIDKEYKEQIITPKADIDSTGNKYTFDLGGSSTLEDYEKFKKTIQETDLLNKISRLSNLCSDGLAFLGIQKNEFWYRDDDIEEIDVTQEIEDYDDGRNRSTESK